MNALALNAAPVEELYALAAEHGVVVDEWDTSTLDARLREGFIGWYAEVYGQPRLIFPLGQDPAERLTVARQLIAMHAEGGAR